MSFFADSVITGTVNILLIKIIPGITVDSGGILLGAVVEPFSSKLLPAALVLFVVSTLDESELSFEKHALVIGLLGGLMMGLGEAYFVKLPKPIDTVHLIAGSMASVVLHMVNGIIVVGTYFSTVKADLPTGSDVPRILIWTIVAVVFHVVWNGWLIDQTWFQKPWYDLLDLMI